MNLSRLTFGEKRQWESPEQEDWDRILQFLYTGQESVSGNSGFDIINITNLNRQQFYYNQIGDYKVRALESNLRKIHPFCKIESHLEKVTTDNLARLFADVDVLIEAFDLAEQKQMLIEHWLQLFPEKPLICASGLAGFGKNELLRQHQSGKLFFCGDGISELVQGISPVAPRVAIVANLQANLCLEILVEVQK
jgi:sulfur carrier protein ThiS adenylyltransferase